MGNQVAKKDQSGEHNAKSVEDRVVEEQKPVVEEQKPVVEEQKPVVEEQKPESQATEPVQECDDNEVFDSAKNNDKVRAQADVNQNNGTSSKGTAVTDSTSTEDPQDNWNQANATDPRPHLVRLFSRDAPGREDNTFKDRPSESDELQTIPEDSGSTSPDTDLMASQKLSRHGSKPMASASTSDRSRYGHGAHSRYRDTGFLDSLGRFFGGDRHVPRKGKDVHLSRSLSRSGYLSSSPQRSYYGHGRHTDDNPVVHFFRNIVTPRTPPPSQPKRGLFPARFSWGGEGHKTCYGSSSPRYYEHHKSSHKGYKDAHRDGQGTLSRIFKLGGRDSRSSSPMARR